MISFVYLGVLGGREKVETTKEMKVREGINPDAGLYDSVTAAASVEIVLTASHKLRVS